MAALNNQHSQQITKLEQSFEQQMSEACRQHKTQADLKLSNMQELTSEHNAALHELETIHAKQLTALKLEHTEALLKQKEDLEALHAGK